MLSKCILRIKPQHFVRNFVRVYDFASVDPFSMSEHDKGQVLNLGINFANKHIVRGEWKESKISKTIIDPWTGEKFIQCPNTGTDELDEFYDDINTCPKSGLHNPLKNVERYLLYGDICTRAAQLLGEPQVERFFIRLIQRVMPKSDKECLGEIITVKHFLENFSSDQVRFMCSSHGVPGDHVGQMSVSYHWPYGPVALITPFNYPLEIPTLQLMGALFIGNKPIIKVAQQVHIVMEQMIRLLHYCGLPLNDISFISCSGKVMNDFLIKSQPAMTMFTGGQVAAEKLSNDVHGKIKIEDAGFDWKILGPDVNNIDYDAYAASGQKCSATSLLFIHKNWRKAGIVDLLKQRATLRTINNMTIGPLLSITNKEIEIPGSRIEFGGKRLLQGSIPSCYGSFEPTAVYVPLEELLLPRNYNLVTKEIFGPFQILTDYDTNELTLIIEACERMNHHLTAAVVSNNSRFINYVLGHTVNGTTYAGIRARTTGAPQNHWFGPAGDPRDGGIGTPESILHVWSCHREVILDIGPIDSCFIPPTPT